MNRCQFLVASCLLLCPITAAAQDATPYLLPNVPVPPPFETTIDVDALNDLPGNANVFSLIGTLVPDVIADRVDSGALSVGEAPRLGAHGSSWTQTRTRIGDVDVTDPDGSGTPLFVPGVIEWQRVAVTSGLMPLEENAPGLAIRLVPRDPTATWTGRVGGSFAPSSFAAGGADHDPPFIQRMDGWRHVEALVSGPLIANRLGLMVAGSAAVNSHFDRADLMPSDTDRSTLFAHLVYTPAPRDTVRTVGLVQRALFAAPAYVTVPDAAGSERDVAAIVQSTWERTGDVASWRAFGGYSRRSRSLEAGLFAPTVIERLLDGPVPELLYPGAGTAPAGVNRRLDAGGRLTLASRRDANGVAGHVATLGIEMTDARARVGTPIDVTIGETVDGMPARVWRYAGWQEPSRWRSTHLSLYGGDRIQLSRAVVVNAGLRFERVTGEADGAANGVAWRDLFPRASLRWSLTETDRFTLLSGYGRYGFSLPLRWLATADPAAPSGDVRRWLAAPGTDAVSAGSIGALIGRVGPGTGGDADLLAIDPEFSRPHMDEFVLGVEWRQGPDTVIRFSGLSRWERQLPGIVGTGLPAAAYTPISIPDSGVGDAPQTLTAFNRDPATLGDVERFTLTNPDINTGRFIGLDLTFERRTDRFWMLAGATAGQFEAFPAYRGFRSVENDRGILGETFANINALTHAEGRQFTERAYTLKMSGVYRFPREYRLGIVARYQDGQPFARYVVFDELNQGPEAVRAFFNGGTRFTFTMTLDARFQKSIDLAGRPLDLVLDVYNFINRQAEIEESQADGPTWRAVTAVQPPLTIHAGVRWRF